MRVLFRRLKPVGFIILLLGFQDLIEFFARAWAILEWILVGMVLLWAIGVRLAAFLCIRMGSRFPFRLFKKNGARLLWAVYWLITLATAGNLIEKLIHGYDPVNLIVLTLGYVFLLFIDYIETGETIEILNSNR